MHLWLTFGIFHLHTSFMLWTWRKAMFGSQMSGHVNSTVAHRQMIEELFAQVVTWWWHQESKSSNQSSYRRRSAVVDILGHFPSTWFFYSLDSGFAFEFFIGFELDSGFYGSSKSCRLQLLQAHQQHTDHDFRPEMQDSWRCLKHPSVPMRTTESVNMGEFYKNCWQIAFFFWWVMFWIMFLFWRNILNSKLVGKKSLQTISTKLRAFDVRQALSKHYLDFREHSIAKQSCWSRPQEGVFGDAPFLEKLMLPTWIRNCETNLKSTNIVWLLGNDVLI